MWLTCADVTPDLRAGIMTELAMLKLLEKLLGFVFALGNGNLLHKASGKVTYRSVNLARPPAIGALLNYLLKIGEVKESSLSKNNKLLKEHSYAKEYETKSHYDQI